MGLSYAVAGVGTMVLTDGEDDLRTRMISGCAAGLSLGIASIQKDFSSISHALWVDKSFGAACGGCLGLSLFSGALKFIDDNRRDFLTKDPQISQAFEPVLITTQAKRE